MGVDTIPPSLIIMSRSKKLIFGGLQLVLNSDWINCLSRSPMFKFISSTGPQEKFIMYVPVPHKNVHRYIDQKEAKKKVIVRLRYI